MKHNLATAVFNNPYPQCGEIVFPDLHIKIHGYPACTTGWPPRPVDKSFIYITGADGPGIIDLHWMDNLNPTAWTRDNLIFYLITHHMDELKSFNIEYAESSSPIENIELPNDFMVAE